jgi:hypothetical protein
MTNRMVFLIGAALCPALSGCGVESLAARNEEPSFALSELAAEPAQPDGVFLVIDAAGPLLVADRDPDPDWASGGIEPVPSRGGGPGTWSVTRRAVDLHKLPPELAHVSGREVLVHAPRGNTCLATLGELELVRRAEPEEPALDDDAGLSLDPESPEERWESPASRVVLGSRVHTLDSSCDGAVWATLTGAAAPLVFTSLERDQIDGADALAELALAALRELPEYGAIEQTYVEELTLDETAGRAERWEHHAGAAPGFAFWRAAGRTLVGVDANAGGGCGDFGAALWALFELREGALELRARDRDAPFPTDVFDLEGDGRLELASGERLMLPTSTGVAVLDVDVPYYGCSC